jgi:CRP-like cAMP-binding protein
MKRIVNEPLVLDYMKQYELDRIFGPEVLRYISLLQLDNGEMLCSSGETLQFMYFLVQGKLKIYSVLDNGKSVLLRFNRPLSVIGDLEYLTDYPVKNNIQSLAPSHLLGIKITDLRNEFGDNPRFLKFLIKNLSHKLYTISNSTSINLSYPLENRIAGYFIATISDENNSPLIHEIKTSKFTEIASLMGTSYRHLVRVINQFIRDGVLDKENGFIVIKDMERLKELAGDNVYE